MRIELESEKEKTQGEPAGEPGLSQKHESDLTKKEKRLLEKEKLKTMSGKEKLAYIWMYYKLAIFGAVAAVFLVIGIANWIENAKITNVLSVTVINSSGSGYDAAVSSLEEFFGIADEKYKTVELSESYSTTSDGDALDTYAQMAFVARVQAKDMDVVLLPESLCESYEEQGYFADLEDVLGEETCAAFEDAMQGQHILISDADFMEQFGVSYEPVCVAVFVNAPNSENAAQWVASLANLVQE